MIAEAGARQRPAELDDPGWLFHEYVVKARRVRDIADELGCGIATVSRAVDQLAAQVKRPRGRRPGGKDAGP